MEHFYWGIEGWFTVEQLMLYQTMIDRSTNGSHIVEVGAWKGRSTSAMGVMIKNSGKNIKFDVVDTFLGSEEHQNQESIQKGTLYSEYINNIAPVEDVVNTIVGDSSNVANFYKDESLDFVFLDGDHSYEGITKDILAWFPKLKPGGILAGDDYSKEFPNVIKSVSMHLADVDVAGNVWIYHKQKMPKIINVRGDEYYNPHYNFTPEVEKAYIIGLKTEEGLVNGQVQRCMKSCEVVGMNYEFFEGFDGTDNLNIKTPEHLRNKDYMSWIKITDSGLTVREIGCALSHIALWAHCITIDKPIVILEHDAVMLKKYTMIPGINMVDYLGNYQTALELKERVNLKSLYDIPEYLRDGNFLTCEQSLPLLGATTENYFYMLGAHAYAIDPFVARKLLTKVMVDGLQNPNDTLVALRDITLHNSGLYAMTGPEAMENSTIMPAIYDKQKVDVSSYRERKNTYIIPSITR